MGEKVRDAVKSCKDDWAQALRQDAQPGLFEEERDLAFAGPYTLLETDQGIRGILHVTNDLCYFRARELDLESWSTRSDVAASDVEGVTEALTSLRRHSVGKFIGGLAGCLATYDWRTSSHPSLTPQAKTSKAAFRGSGGYRELRRALLLHMMSCGGELGKDAKKVFESLGFK
jgi:hypothetical protein